MLQSSWRSAAPLVAGRAGSAAVGILLPAVLARSLSQADYGSYKQLYIVANLALYTMQLGLGQSLFYFVPRAATASERRAWLSQTQSMLLGLGLLSGLVLFTLAPYIADRFSNPTLASLALPIAVLAGAMIAASPLEIGLTARGRPGLSALALVGTDILRVGAMLIPVWLGQGLAGLAWGAALAAVFKALLSIASCWNREGVSMSRESLRRQLIYALPFGFAVLVSMPQQQMHQLVVASQASPELFALYAVGCMQIPVVGLLYSPISETMQVRLGLLENEDKDLAKTRLAFSEAVSHLSSVFFPLCVFLMATAAPGISILYGSKYLAAVPIFQVAVASVAVSSLPVDGLMKARNRTQILFVANVGKLFVTWPAIVQGYKSFGMLGAIGAHVAVEGAFKLSLLGVIVKDIGKPVVPQIVRGLTRGGARAARVGAGAWAGVALTSSPFLQVSLACAFSSLVLGGEWWFAHRTRAPLAQSTERAA